VSATLPVMLVACLSDLLAALDFAMSVIDLGPSECPPGILTASRH
jgi:hypothetical protein